MPDTLSYRLAYILIKLNQGERLHLGDLAKELNVSVRTLQRDVNERFAGLPIEKVDGYYQMMRGSLGDINIQDLEKFAQLAGIRELFPSLSASFVKRHLQAFEDQVSVSSIGVQPVANAAFTEQSRQYFFALEKAISQKNILHFQYTTRENKHKSYREVQPYRLTHQDGFWYLSAVHNSALKSFAINRMESLDISNETFERSADYESQLLADDSVWLGEKFTVTLAVTGKAKQYFKQRQLVPQQAIIAETDEVLTITAQVRHEDQILPIVQYWIPYIRVVEPLAVREKLMEGLRRYLV